MPKRTHSISVPNTGKMAARSYVPRNNLGTRSLLLDLPRELRNSIYQYVVTPIDAFTVQKGSLVPHPLARANRQLRQEFLPVFRNQSVVCPHTLNIHITNFDFRTVVTWVNKILAGSGVDVLDYCRLNITITVSKDPFLVNSEHLRRWLWRCETVDGMRPFRRKYEYVFTWDAPDVGIPESVRTLIEGVNDEESSDGRLLSDSVYLIRAAAPRKQTGGSRRRRCC